MAQPTPLMPHATASWLVDNTSLSFEQIADFCGLHILEVQAMADDLAGSKYTGRLVDLTWTDGTPARSVFHYPHSFVLLELFKIVDGKIAGVEAVFVTVPYNMVSAW